LTAGPRRPGRGYSHSQKRRRPLVDIETSLDEVDAYVETILQHLGDDPPKSRPRKLDTCGLSPPIAVGDEVLSRYHYSEAESATRSATPLAHDPL
jgi:hypothetical protein